MPEPSADRKGQSSRDFSPTASSLSTTPGQVILCVHVLFSHDRLCDPMDCGPPGSSVHGIFPGRNTGVGCRFLLQRAFLMQGSNPRLLYLLCCQVASLPLSRLVITRSETTGSRPWRQHWSHLVPFKTSCPWCQALIIFYPVYFFLGKKNQYIL